MSILVAARAHGLQAIDGPFLKVRDEEGFRRAAARTAALGFDGKWVLHPSQVDAGNEVFSPRQDEFDKAEGILAAYAHSTSVEGGAGRCDVRRRDAGRASRWHSWFLRAAARPG